MAAQGYPRLTSRPALVQVTTGPGGTNALTGVYGAYVDSLPMIVVSGRVKRETMAVSAPSPLRQLGDQEVDIVAMARPVTKYAACVTDPATIRYHLERALHEAVSGRPGPVWIDIPVDVQATVIDETTLVGFAPVPPVPAPLTGPAVDAAVAVIAARLARAERPVLYAGAGVRLSGAADDFARLVERLGIPVVSGFNAHDLVSTDHPLYVGRPGTIGDRPELRRAERRLRARRRMPPEHPADQLRMGELRTGRRPYRCGRGRGGTRQAHHPARARRARRCGDGHPRAARRRMDRTRPRAPQVGCVVR